MIFLLNATTLLTLNRLGRESLSLAPSEVLDVVIAECHHPKYFDAYHFVGMTGLQTIVTLPSWMHESSVYCYPGLSLQDRLSLHYAKLKQRILITDLEFLHFICSDKDIESRSCQYLVQGLLP